MAAGRISNCSSRVKYLLFAIGTIILCYCSEKSTVSALDETLETINIDEFLTHIEILSDDRLLGRSTGTPGYDSASNYIEQQLVALNLKPGGTNGSYRQPISFQNASLIEHSIAINGDQLTSGSDYALSPLTTDQSINIEAPLVFAGLGIYAPELAYDSYQDLEVSGKVVIIIRDAPDRFDLVERAVTTSSEFSGNTLMDKGALAVIRVFPESYGNVRSWPVIVDRTSRSRLMYHDQSKAKQEIPSVVLKEEIAKEIFSKLDKDYNQILAELLEGHLLNFETDLKVSIKAQFDHGSLSSHNLAAIIEGSDEKLKDEFLIVTAHLDHIGVSKGAGSDSINNGTLDNASGSAAIMMLAGAFKRLPPKRSIMFLWLTAEEKGLLGSEYFAIHPTIPSRQIAANLNMDGIIGMIVETTDVIAYGYQHSNLSQSVDFAVDKMVMSVSEDPLPEQNIFVRSDQYSFVKQGYPALYVVSGRNAYHRHENGLELFNNWLRNRYHQPSDDMSQPMSMKGIEKELKVNFLTAYHIANLLDTVKWSKDSFLYKRFASPKNSQIID